MSAVIGIGNILMKDDGVGIYAVRVLQKEIIDEDVELVDGGTSTLDMLKYFVDHEKVIVIDCLKSGRQPGTIYRINPQEITSYAKESLSLHDVQILDVIKIAEMMGAKPEVIVIGVEPQELSLGLGLTDACQCALDKVVRYVKQEL